MFSLTYVSTATTMMSVPQLVELVEESRPRNRERGLTGMLLYSGGNVIQVLEGPRSDVETVFASIERDPRHRDVVLLQTKEVEERAFPDWAMGFRNISEREVRDVMTLADFVRQPTADGLGDRAERIYDLLSLFRASA